MQKDNKELEEASEIKALGNAQFKQKNYLPAIELYTKAIQVYDKEASYFGNRAACYLALSEWHKCIADCNQALILNQQFTKAMRRKATAHLNLGQLEKAIDANRKVCELEPNSFNRQALMECVRVMKTYQAAQKQRNDGKLKEANNLLGSISKKYPDFLEVKQQLIEVNCELGDNKQTVKLLNNYIKQHGQTAEVFYYKGLQSLLQGNIEVAKKFYKQGMQFDPDNKKIKMAFKQVRQIERIRQAGNDLFKQQKYEEAIEKYTEGLEVSKMNKHVNAILYSNRATAYLRMDNKTEAMCDLDRAIEQNPKFIKAYLKKANLYNDMEEYDRVVGMYNEVKTIAPGYPQISQLIKQAQEKSKKAAKLDYYKILGVDRKATTKEIKKAYRKLVMIWHPDKVVINNDEDKRIADKKIKELNEAWSVLGDPEKRAQVDDGTYEMRKGGGGGGGMGGQGMGDIFKMFFGGGGMGGGGGGGGFRHSRSRRGGGGHSHGFPGGGGGGPGGYSFKFG